MLSAFEHPKEVDDYIAKELSTSHLAVYVNPMVQIQTSPLGVIPKKGKENRWRLIMDLSAPHGSSVNDGIDRDLCSFHYVSVDTAAARMHTLGRGALLAKMDIKQAYRHIPVAPEDRHLLGLSWKGATYIDQVLPFGLRSAPLIFSAVADALQWMLINRGVSWTIHYIDDFLTMGAPHSKECGSNMEIMEATCASAGLPIEPAKSVGPASCLTFLGIELDSVEGVLRLPQEKLQNIIEILQQWRGYKACKKRNLLSLIGVLSHAAKVVKPGRAFLRRLIDLSTSAEKLDHFIRLNVEARSDIEWWWQFISRWNGISAAPSLVHLPPEIQFTSDASGAWGCGAYWHPQWFQLKWTNMLSNAHISVKELTPIVLAVATWGHLWHCRTIQVLSDNTAAVAAINNNSSKVRESAHLLRCLAFLSARFQCQITAKHLPGSHNNISDAISRNQLSQLWILSPQANLTPTQLSEEVIQLLIAERPDWTSQRWSTLWNTIFSAE